MHEGTRVEPWKNHLMRGRINRGMHAGLFICAAVVLVGDAAGNRTHLTTQFRAERPRPRCTSTTAPGGSPG